jgi:TRAP-type C4-dicarboxylate transport system permease large subunit
VLILNAGIGLNTPPVGSVQFVACAIGKISIGESMKTIWPFYGASIAVLLAVTYIPALSLWLPSVFR